MLGYLDEEGIEYNSDAIAYMVEELFGYMNKSEAANTLEDIQAEDGEFPISLIESVNVIAAFPIDEFNLIPSNGVLYEDDFVIILNNEGIAGCAGLPYCLYYSIR